MLSGKIDGDYLRQLGDAKFRAACHECISKDKHSCFEVCYIILDYIGREANKDLHESQKVFWAALEMFAPITEAKLRGVEYDNIRNVFLVTLDAFRDFETMEVYLEATAICYLRKVLLLGFHSHVLSGVCGF